MGMGRRAPGPGRHPIARRIWEGQAPYGQAQHLIRTGTRAGRQFGFIFLVIFNRLHGQIGGDGGIRTLDRALQPYNGLANRRLQPLGHVSARDARREVCPTHPPIASAGGRPKQARCRKALLGKAASPSFGGAVKTMASAHGLPRRRDRNGLERADAQNHCSFAAAPYAAVFRRPKGLSGLSSRTFASTADAASQPCSGPKTRAPGRTRNTNRLIRRGQTAGSHA